jgi:elongation factor Ts
MQKISITQIQELRRRTGAGITDCKHTLESTEGNMDAAVEELRKRGITKAAEREARKTTEGTLASYMHHNGRLAALVELNCETDFVARTDDFRTLAKQLAEHIAAAGPLAVDIDEVPEEAVAQRRAEIEEQLRVSNKPEHLHAKILDGKLDAFYREVVLVKQPWVREPKRTIGDLIKETSARVGEHVKVRRFARFEMETVRVTPEGET